MEEHLCLPVSSGVQFAIKFLFVVAIGGILSVVLLGVAEGIGSAVGARSGMTVFSQGEHLGANYEGFVVLSLIIIALSLIGFYVSTLTRNVLQALAAGAVIAVIFVVLGMASFEQPALFGRVLWRGYLAQCIAAPTLLLTLLCLGYSNFRRLSENWRLWLRNILALTITLTCVTVSTAAIYNRVWEKFMRLEPPHGPARLSGSHPASMERYGREVLAMLPDGRLWEDRVEYTEYASNRTVMSLGNFAIFFDISHPDAQRVTSVNFGGKWTGLTKNHFFQSSNWVDAVAANGESVGIRSDGTLWVSEKPVKRILQNGKRNPEPLDRLVRVGVETNWLRAVREHYTSVLLLKKDGTLWTWGTNNFSTSRGLPEWPGLHAFEPCRLGTESDWAEIFSSGRVGYAWKNDGRAWALNAPDERSEYRGNELAPGTRIERWALLDKTKWRALANSPPFETGVREDGTLWVWSFWSWVASGTGENLSKRSVQIGKGTNWAAVAGDDRILVAIKTDGSLWKWDLSYWRGRGGWPFAGNPVRMSTHKDWIAVAATYGEMVSLAADGSFWYWWGEESLHPGQPWLGASRKPVKIENIFENEK